MRVARYREASEKAPAQIGVPGTTLISPVAQLHASTKSLASMSSDLESVPLEGFKNPSVDDVEDGGLSFAAVYKKGYGDE